MPVTFPLHKELPCSVWDDPSRCFSPHVQLLQFLSVTNVKLYFHKGIRADSGTAGKVKLCLHF